MNTLNIGKYLAAFAVGLAVMYGAWYVHDAEQLKGEITLAQNQVDLAQAELVKAQAEIERLKTQAVEQGLLIK